MSDSIMEIAVGAALEGVFAIAENRQAVSQAEAQARADVDELDRQSQEDLRRMQAERSDRIVQADREIARVIVGLEGVGGSGGRNEARLIGELGAMEGLDLARISGNFTARQRAREASGERVRRELKGTVQRARAANVGAGLKVSEAILGARRAEDNRRRERDLRHDNPGLSTG